MDLAHDDSYIRPTPVLIPGQGFYLSILLTLCMAHRKRRARAWSYWSHGSQHTRGPYSSRSSQLVSDRMPTTLHCWLYVAERQACLSIWSAQEPCEAAQTQETRSLAHSRHFGRPSLRVCTLILHWASDTAANQGSRPAQNVQDRARDRRGRLGPSSLHIAPR